MADWVAVLATSAASNSSSGSTGGKTLSGTAHSVALTTSVRLVLAVVVTVAVEMHALVTLELLALELSSVWLRATLELSELLGSSLSKSSTLRSELVKSLDREGGSAMVHGGGMVSLVNGDCCMDNVRLNSFFLDNRLDMLMDMVMNSLSCHDRSSLSRSCGAVSCGCILESGGFAVQGSPRFLVVSMVELLVFNRRHVVVVLLRENFLVCNWLHSCVMMLLMNLLVESSGYALMLVRLDLLLNDMRSDIFVDSSLVLSVVGKEARNGLLCFLHDD